MRPLVGPVADLLPKREREHLPDARHLADGRGSSQSTQLDTRRGVSSYAAKIWFQDIGSIWQSLLFIVDHLEIKIRNFEYVHAPDQRLLP